MITVSLAIQLIELRSEAGGATRNRMPPLARGGRECELPEADLRWKDIVYFKGADEEAREVPLLFLYGVQASRGGPAPVPLLAGKGIAPPEPQLVPTQDASFMAAMELYKRVKAVVFVRTKDNDGELRAVDPALLVKAVPPNMNPKDVHEDSDDTRVAFDRSGVAARLPTVGGSQAFGATTANLPYAEHDLLLNSLTTLVSRPTLPVTVTASATLTRALTLKPQPSSQPGKQGGPSLRSSHLGQAHKGSPHGLRT